MTILGFVIVLAAKSSVSFVTPWTVVCQVLSVHGIFLARILEWVAISFSKGSSHPGIKPTSPALAVGFFTTEPPQKPFVDYTGSFFFFNCGIWGIVP